MTQAYATFLERKTHHAKPGGITHPTLPAFLFDFQAHLVAWALQHSRTAIFAGCGLGKTPMALVWAENICRATNGRVLILTPVAVGAQFVSEGEKFGIPVSRSRTGAVTGRIVVSNYEQLHKFSPGDFTGVICDESSCLKHAGGVTQKAVTRFLTHVSYRLLATATAAPNDYAELGTSSEALGNLGVRDMLARFFKQDKQAHRLHDIHTSRQQRQTATAESATIPGMGGSWHLKAHAVVPFWRWVCSWARACRQPSDLGPFDDRPFRLPPLIEKEYLVLTRTIMDGMLFALPVQGFHAAREERRRTIPERCEQVAQLVEDGEPALVWCHLNDEGDLLEQLIPDAVQVKGADSEEAKEEAYHAFVTGEKRVLIAKPTIAGWGMNFQHCAHMVTFPSYSFEGYYQQTRRCWRFGQQRPVRSDIVLTQGEQHVSAVMARKATAAAHMFEALVQYMHDAEQAPAPPASSPIGVPAWLH